MSNKRKQRTLTDKEFLELMRKKKGKTFLKDFAKQFRVSFQFLGKVLAGKCGPGPKIAKALGYQQQTIFVALEPKAKKVKKAPKVKGGSSQVATGPKNALKKACGGSTTQALVLSDRAF